MIKAEDYLTTIPMPPIIDIDGDQIGIEVRSLEGKLWKFSSSIAWNVENYGYFPEWINFKNIGQFEVVIDHNRITKDTEPK